MTLADLAPGDTFTLPPARTRYILKAHREGNDIRRPWVDCIELDRYGQQRRWRCFTPHRTARLVRAAG
jgi:hypothetical protein